MRIEWNIFATLNVEVAAFDDGDKSQISQRAWTELEDSCSEL
jgi:hypothetical protein